MISEEKESRVLTFLRSLPGRMIVSILVLTLILGALLMSSILFLSINAQKASFVQNSREEANTLARAMGLDPDYLEIKGIFANSVLSHRVVYVELAGTIGHGESFKQAKDSHLKFLQDTEFGGHGDNVYYLSEPIRDGNGKLIGVLKIGYDELRLANQAKHMIHRSVVFGLVYMWALMLITASLAMRLTNPIKSLQKACREIASGQIDKVLNIESNISEISGLGNDLEHMRRELVASNKKIAASEARYLTILDHAAEGIFIFDKQGVIHSFNRSAEQLFGYSEDEIVGRDIAALITPPGVFEHSKDHLKNFMQMEISRLIGRESELTGFHKDGSSFHMALKVRAVVLEEKEMYT
ncbi:MAG: PAS domain S-box protein, partial [Burkholderiales bacterium]